MTTPHDLYIEAARHGLRLEPAGDKLAVIPKGKCPPAFRDTLLANKTALLDWLSRPPCPGYGAVPPADLPLVNLRPRPSIHSRELVIHFELRQTDNRPGALAAWLARREAQYFDGCGTTWDCGTLAYAAARDAACWQLNRSEAEVWQLLAGFDEASGKTAV
jgi:hypothetical protein